MFDIFYFEKCPSGMLNAIQVKSLAEAQMLCRTRFFWLVDYLCDYTDWDFLWEPAPWNAEFKQAFASQWQKDSGTYLIPKQGYSETKYNQIVCPKIDSFDNWNSTEYPDFDYSWHPDPTDPPYIYRFGTQHQKTGGPIYTVPGATETKYVSYPKVEKLTIDLCWDNLEFDDFDYTWHPDDTEQNYVYHFGTQWQKTGGPKYIVPGATQVKYVNQPRIKKVSVDPYWKIPSDIEFDDFDYTWHPDPTDPPYIYQFGTQWQKTGGPQYIVPGATEIKYVNSPRVTKTSVDSHWEIPDAEFGDFDYTWHADDTEQPYIYQFATQHQKTGGPKYVVPGATEIKYVDEVKIKARRVATGMVLIKHTTDNPELQTDIPVIESTRFISDYLGTLRRICNKIEGHEYIWVVSDLCDYKDFDFSWHPEIWQNTMLHVFPSNEQKFGDTFFIHVESFLQKSSDIEVLEWFNPLNFVQEKSVPRNNPVQIQYNSDNLVEEIRKYTFKDPLVQFYRYAPEKPVTVSLWQEKLRTVVPLNSTGESVIVPRDAKNYVTKQIYDYQWIDKTHKKDKPGTEQDIVFISYDETNADENFAVLKSKFPRAKRLHGVDGMVNAIKQAAECSETDYFYAVFAKTQISDTFKFNFSPDYLKVPSHYLFHGRNMSNGLEYGTLGVTMYNCKLVIEATEWGVDFTTSFPVEVVPELSALGYFATDPYRAWRTAFRECTKLQSKCIDRQVDIETNYRLNVWTSHAEGPFADWVLQGARDGVEFANSGEDIMQINDWNWLAKRFQSRYSKTVSAT